MAFLRTSTAGLVAVALVACTPPRPPPPSCSATPGALVITEYLANPDGEDKGKEWFEVYNPGDAPVELAGLTLALAKSDGAEEKTFTVPSTVAALAPDAYFVFGDHREGEMPSWLGFSYADRLRAMGNEDGKLLILCGTDIVDTAVYTTAQKSGQSAGFDGARTPDSVENDAAEPWCPATQEFSAGLKGSPGAPNEDCPVVVDPDTCLDAGTGARRAVVRPAEGDLVISELMPNPKAIVDSSGEWIELFALTDVDLNGLQLSLDGAGPTVASNDCLPVAAGEFALLARKVAAAENGGLEGVLTTFAFDLPNSGDRTLVLKSGDLEIDRIAYSSAPDGKSLQVPPDFLDATANDVPEAWCAATAAMPNGDFGTPGEENTACEGGPQPGTCLDPGTGEPREPVAPAAGDLVISEFMANPKSVDDGSGEWIELFVKRDVDLNGVQLRNEGTGKTTLAGNDCLRVTADSYVLLARKTDPLLNGNLEGVLAPFGFSLANSGPRALVVAVDALEIDRVTYEAVGDGIARQVDPGQLDATANDAATAWCNAVTDHANGDKGTPGAENPACAP